MANIVAKIEQREKLSKSVKEIVKFTPNSKIREGEEYGVLNIVESENPEKNSSVNLISLAKGQVVMSTSLNVSNVEGGGSFLLDVEYFSEAISNMYDDEIELTIEGDKLSLKGDRNNVVIPVFKKDESSIKAPIKRYAELEKQLRDEIKDSHVIEVGKDDFVKKLEAAQIFSFEVKDIGKYNALTVGEDKVSILGRGTAILGRGIVNIEKTLKKGDINSTVMITEEVGKILMSTISKAERKNIRIFVGSKKLIFQVDSNTIVIPKKEYEGNIEKLENYFNGTTDCNYMIQSEDVKNLCSMVTFLEKRAKIGFKKETYKIKVTVDAKDSRVISKGENWIECRSIGIDKDNVSMEVLLSKLEDSMSVFPKSNADNAIKMSIVKGKTSAQVHFTALVKPKEEEKQNDISNWLRDDLVIILAANTVSEEDVVGV